MNTNVEISTLSNDELDAVSGGSTLASNATISPITNSTISVPHVRPQDLLPPQVVERLLSITSGFNPPVRNG